MYLFYFEGASYEQIAREIETNTNNVGKVLHDAREKLRTKLGHLLGAIFNLFLIDRASASPSQGESEGPEASSLGRGAGALPGVRLGGTVGRSRLLLLAVVPLGLILSGILVGIVASSGGSPRGSGSTTLAPPTTATVGTDGSRPAGTPDVASSTPTGTLEAGERASPRFPDDPRDETVPMLIISGANLIRRSSASDDRFYAYVIAELVAPGAVPRRRASRLDLQFDEQYGTYGSRGALLCDTVDEGVSLRAVVLFMRSAEADAVPSPTGILDPNDWERLAERMADLIGWKGWRRDLVRASFPWAADWQASTVVSALAIEAIGVNGKLLTDWQPCAWARTSSTDRDGGSVSEGPAVLRELDPGQGVRVLLDAEPGFDTVDLGGHLSFEPGSRRYAANVGIIAGATRRGDLNFEFELPESVSDSDVGAWNDRMHYGIRKDWALFPDWNWRTDGVPFRIMKAGVPVFVFDPRFGATFRGERDRLLAERDLVLPELRRADEAFRALWDANRTAAIGGRPHLAEQGAYSLQILDLPPGLEIGERQSGVYYDRESRDTIRFSLPVREGFYSFPSQEGVVPPGRVWTLPSLTIDAIVDTEGKFGRVLFDGTPSWRVEIVPRAAPR